MELSLSLSLSRVAWLGAVFLTLALLIGSGFLFQGDAWATLQYQPVFSDNFDRVDGPAGNGWSFDGSQWLIENNTFKPPTYNTSVPLVAFRQDLVAFGRASVKVDMTSLDNNNESVFLVSNYNDTPTKSMYVSGVRYQGGNLILNQYKLENYTGGNWVGELAMMLDYSTNLVQVPASVVTQGFVTLKYIVTPTADGVQLTLDVYDGSTNTLLASRTVIEKVNVLATGKWGITTVRNAANEYVDDFVLEKEINLANSRSVLSGSNWIKNGDSVSFQLVSNDATAAVATFTDGGAGGVFDNATVTANSSNDYVSPVINYVPAKNGNVTITASLDNGETIERVLYITPYSSTIGHIGDSIMAGMGGYRPAELTANILGDKIVSIDRSVGATRTIDWVNDTSGPSNVNCQTFNANCTGPNYPLLTNALAAFNANGVDIVHLMLGRNDVGLAPETWKNQTQTLISKLKDGGIKHVILSGTIWGVGTSGSVILEFQEKILEIIAESEGYVLLGDLDGMFTYSKDNWAAVNSDGIHLNGNGLVKMSEYWAEAIDAAIKYQMNPDGVWSSLDNEHWMGSTSTLTYSVDKYFGEFSGIVEVDGQVLASSEYIALPGSTKIELSNAFLNSLSVGSHTLAVRFYGGVTTVSNFSILTSTTGGQNGGVSKVPNAGVNTFSNLEESNGAFPAPLLTAASMVTLIGLIFIGYKRLV